MRPERRPTAPADIDMPAAFRIVLCILPTALVVWAHGAHRFNFTRKLSPQRHVTHALRHVAYLRQNV